MSSRVASGPDDGAAPAGDVLLRAHLQAYLGAWPDDRSGVTVVGGPGRLEPGWDGSRALAVVVKTPDGTVISVPPGRVEQVNDLSARLASPDFPAALAEAVGSPGRASPWIVLRWSTAPAPLEPLGTWVDAQDGVLPEWLHAFPSPVLAAFDEDGGYLGGVGIKRHSRWGRELAVGTAEEARGRGVARRLVAHAARAVLEDGALPLYVHDPENVPSAREADAAGFPDVGWRLLYVFGPRSTPRPSDH